MILQIKGTFAALSTNLLYLRRAEVYLNNPKYQIEDGSFKVFVF